MKIIYLFVFCIFLLSCHESENNELLEFNKEYVNLGGVCVISPLMLKVI
jgi:hypothetical protein